MAELIRSVVSRVRTYLKDRRRSPRLYARLALSVSVRSKATSNGSVPPSHTLKGHTRDISSGGLGLLLPQVHLGGYHLAAEGRELHIRLELPNGPMAMTVLPRRYEMLDEPDLGCNYLIGAKIVELSDQERKRLESFITKGLSGDSRRSSSED